MESHWRRTNNDQATRTGQLEQARLNAKNVVPPASYQGSGADDGLDSSEAVKPVQIASTKKDTSKNDPVLMNNKDKMLE